MSRGIEVADPVRSVGSAVSISSSIPCEHPPRDMSSSEKGHCYSGIDECWWITPADKGTVTNKGNPQVASTPPHYPAAFWKTLEHFGPQTKGSTCSSTPLAGHLESWGTPSSRSDSVPLSSIGTILVPLSGVYKQPMYMYAANVYGIVYGNVYGIVSASETF
eukprot:gene6519-biopygen2431